MRRGVVVIALAGLLAGCGGTHQAAPTTTTTPKTVTGKHRVCRAQVAKLVITILDGDTLQRVEGARVRIHNLHGVTGKHGVVVLKGQQRRLGVSVSRRGYTTVHVRASTSCAATRRFASSSRCCSGRSTARRPRGPAPRPASSCGRRSISSGARAWGT